MKKIWPLNVITFLSAFLLFQIELIIAKMFLPNYGGSYLVWGACVVFFQASLLLGYVFAHFAIKRMGMARYRLFYLFLLVVPLMFFPGRDLVVQYAENQMPLALDVFLRLLVTIGPVFFVLSTISITTQVWLSSSDLPERHNPYALYAVSNIGSFAALLTYPFVVEACLDLSRQVTIWRLLYFVLLMCSAVAFWLIKAKDGAGAKGAGTSRIKLIDSIRWLLLGAGGVIMFLSVTNMITYEIVPMPLLWVIPLGIYLLAFVLNFKQQPWCPTWVKDKVHLILGFSVMFYFLLGRSLFPELVELGLLCWVVFATCMYCQRQLILHKPKNDGNLSTFYVLISLGGFLGGFITSWVAPLVSTGPMEYLLGLGVIAVAAAFDQTDKSVKFYFVRLMCYMIVILIVWPTIFHRYNIWGLLLIVFLFRMIFTELRHNKIALALTVVLVLFLYQDIGAFWKDLTPVYRKRNYYGIYDVSQDKIMRRFVHGATLHGAQFLNPKFAPEPTAYYARKSPIGQYMIANLFPVEKIGVVGLGTGSIAAYTSGKQVLDFYELDPEMYTIATKYFGFVPHCPSKINFIFGDARLSLDQRPEIFYDLMIIDAFGGDAIPVHLLTNEMIAKYHDHLRPGGVLLFHISNRYVRLGPPLKRIASEQGAYLCYRITRDEGIAAAATWVMMTWDKDRYDRVVNQLKWSVSRPMPEDHDRLWTDQYSNLLKYLRTDSLLYSIKTFQPFNW